MSFLSTIILGSFSYLIFLPLFLILIVVNEIIRFGISLILYPSNYTLIPSGWDAIFGVIGNKYGGGMVVGCMATEREDLAEDETAMELEKEVCWFQQRVFEREDKAYDKLKWILTKKLGFGAFFKGTFILKNHIKIFENPITEEELSEKFVPAAMKFMSPTKPQWEWWIFSSVQFQGEERPKTVRLFRFNHAYFDGPSAGTFYADVLMDWKTPDLKAPWIHDPKAPLRKEHAEKLFSSKLLSLLILPYEIVRRVYTSKKAATNAPSSVSSREKAYIKGKSVPLELLKSAATSTSTTIESVLIDAVAKGISKALPGNELKCQFPEATVTMATTGCIYPYPDYQGRNQPFLFHVNVPFDAKEPIKIHFPPTALTTYYCPEIFGRFPLFVVEGMFGPGKVSSQFCNVGNLVLTKVGHNGLIRGKAVTDLGVWVNSITETDMVINFLSYSGKVDYHCTIKKSSVLYPYLSAFLQNLDAYLQNWGTTHRKPRQHRNSLTG